MPQASEHRVGRARDHAVVTSQPKAAAKLPSGHRALSQERHAAALASATAANGLSPAPKLRLLPPRPGPLDDRGKKLELDRGRASKRGEALRVSACRRGPVKADHAVRVPGSPQMGAMPGSASFSLPAGASLAGREAERRRSNLARSKSISIGDLSQGGGGGRAEDVAAVLSRLVLRDCSHQLSAGSLALRRSSSLRRVNVSPGLDGKPTTPLLSVRPEGCPRTRTAPDPTYAHSPDIPAPGSPPLGRAPAPGRTEEKAAAVRALGFVLGTGQQLCSRWVPPPGWDGGAGLTSPIPFLLGEPRCERVKSSWLWGCWGLAGAVPVSASAFSPWSSRALSSTRPKPRVGIRCLEIPGPGLRRWGTGTWLGPHGASHTGGTGLPPAPPSRPDPRTALPYLTGVVWGRRVCLPPLPILRAPAVPEVALLLINPPEMSLQQGPE